MSEEQTRRCVTCGATRPIGAFDVDARGWRKSCRDCRHKGGIPASNPDGISEMLSVLVDMYERDRRLTDENRELRQMMRRRSGAVRPVPGGSHRTASQRVGTNVRRLREIRGWTLAQLSDATAAVDPDDRIDLATLSRIETQSSTDRRSRLVRVEELEQLATIFSVTVEDLLA